MISIFHSLLDRLTDSLCALSLIGIWPRFIEPLWLEERHESVKLGSSPSAIKIAHLSDLHWNELTPSRLIESTTERLREGKPDLILFTGDFLCYGKPYGLEKLSLILKQWRRIAPVVACLGNHDYSQYVTQRDGKVRIQVEPLPFLLRAFKRLCMPRAFFKNETHEGLKVEPHPQLLDLLKSCNIQFLINESCGYEVKGQSFSILGVGDLWADDLSKIQQLQKHTPQIILAHNPDSLDHLKSFEKALVLCGHTHGGNVNLKGIRGKIRSVSQIERLKGWQKHTKHLAYVNRGLGNPYPFRFFSRPELTWIDLHL
jgi:predicted MPP superfamily phosphohydrolase